MSSKIYCIGCVRLCLRSIILGASSRPLSSITSQGDPVLQLARTAQQQRFQKRRYASRPAVKSLRLTAAVRSVEKTQARHDDDDVALEKERREKDWAIKQETKFLRDPLKLSTNTLQLLKRGNKDRALEIVKAISKYGSYVVAWNHLIDYEMSQKRVNSAMEIYNDVCWSFPAARQPANSNQMKKRRQSPDAHTCTIVLRGLAWNYEYGRSLQRALTVYHSMFAENSTVKPSVIHTNAVLQVCALANDMEALWGIAAKLPSGGKYAADATTFTIIFNAICNNIVAKPKDEAKYDDRQRRLRRRDVQSQCRKIWGDVIERWRENDLAIDETLVHAIGRTLVLSDNVMDNHDVLDLVEQTMAIPRQIPRIDTYGLKKLANVDAARSGDRNGDVPQHESSSLPSVLEQDNETGMEGPEERDFSAGDEFRPLPKSDRKLIYAAPSRKTLSLLLEVCLNLKALGPAEKYWELLTARDGTYRIPPDRENYIRYLRTLRVRRASRLSLSVLQEMTARLGQTPERKAFRIALSACCRDTKNPNVLENTKAIIQMMNTETDFSDVEALADYITVVQNAKLSDWKDLKDAVDFVWPTVEAMRSDDDTSPNVKELARKSPTRGENDEVLSLSERLQRVWKQCLLLAESKVSRAEWRSMTDRKNKLSGWHQRLREQRMVKDFARGRRHSDRPDHHQHDTSRPKFKFNLRMDPNRYQERSERRLDIKVPSMRKTPSRGMVRYF